MADSKANLVQKIPGKPILVRPTAALRKRVWDQLRKTDGATFQGLVTGLLTEWVDHEAPLPAVPELPNELEYGLSEEDVQILHKVAQFLRRKKTTKEDKKLLSLLTIFFAGSE